jgi:hypothetical protein
MVASFILFILFIMLNVDASTRPARGGLCPLVAIMLNVDASTGPARGGLCPRLDVCRH